MELKLPLGLRWACSGTLVLKTLVQFVLKEHMQPLTDTRTHNKQNQQPSRLFTLFPKFPFLCCSPSPKEKEKMKLNVCVHFIMSVIAFWKLQVAECLTFSCQASSCWDNKCLSSFAHSGGCRLQTAGARRSLNTIPIRTPVLVPPLWLASLHARNLLLSNIYTQLEWQMYRNFTHALPHTWNRCAYFCVFLSFGRGGLFFVKKGRGRAKLQHKQSEIFIASFHPEVSGGGRCGWLQLLESFYCTFFGWKVGERLFDSF